MEASACWSGFQLKTSSFLVAKSRCTTSCNTRWAMPSQICDATSSRSRLAIPSRPTRGTGVQGTRARP
eukprot:763474-Hanusia_phi.AAC.2